MSALVIVIVAQFLVTLVTSQGNPIPTFDEWIGCYGAPPPSNAGWPPNRSPSDYTDNLQLCSQVYGATNHIGCVCNGPGPENEPECSLANHADPVLFNAPLQPMRAGFFTFPQFCYAQCICLPEATAEQFQMLPMEQREAIIDHAQEVADQLDNQRATSVSGGGASDPLRDQLGAGSGGPDSASCGGSCTAGTECSETNCVCKVTGSTYLPRLGSLVYQSRCVASFAGRKREIGIEEKVACPCNTTYVSEGCCHSRDGMVHEPPEKKLGELAVHHGLELL